jgi:hypothetical protein
MSPYLPRKQEVQGKPEARTQQDLRYYWTLRVYELLELRLPEVAVTMKL